MQKLSFLICICLFLSISTLSFGQKATLVPTPPLGWNSYNSFGAAVMESEVKANADYMAKNLKQYGWQYVVVDYCWFYPHPPGSTQNNPPQFRLKKDGAYVPFLPMDENGRLLPDPRKFPSAAGGQGFKPLADYVHSLGLKFGIHVMRGIPRQAVWAKSPVIGTSVTAADIVDTTSVCPWLNNMWGVNMKKEGAQAYYNSILKLYAQWGVDYIKLDDTDLDEKYPYRADEVAAFYKAIEQCGRPIVLSLSLNMKWENREHAKANSDVWRISKDFWDSWAQVEEQFELCAKWAPISEPGNFPDADMLQLGRISKRGPEGNERFSRLTEDEQYTHMTLWSIFRSPLMMGGNMPENTEFVKNLLTNNEVLDVNQKGYEARQLYRKDEMVVWVSKVPGSKDLNVALFNLSKEAKNVPVDFAQLGLKGSSFTVRDLWAKKEMGSFKKTFAQKINSHGAGLYRIHVK